MRHLVAHDRKKGQTPDNMDSSLYQSLAHHSNTDYLLHKRYFIDTWVTPCGQKTIKHKKHGPCKSNMSFIHNHSFYTTMDTLCRNMTLALNICEKNIQHQSNAQSTWSVKEVSNDFSNMFKSVTDGYAHMAPPTSLQSSVNGSPYDTPHTNHNNHNDHNNGSQDQQDQLESVIAKAMNIESMENQDHTQEGGIPFSHGQNIDEDTSSDESSQVSDDTSSDESSMFLEDMLPGQRENYFKTKQMAEGIRQAQIMDEKYFQNE